MTLRRTFSILVSVSLFFAAAPSHAAIFTVTNTNTSGAGSLAQAIADANLTADADVINFNIVSATPVLTIGGLLPAITQSLTINGYSQPDTSKNNSVINTTNAVLRIELDASAVPVAGAAIKIQSGAVSIQGIAIRNIPNKSIGIEIASDETSSVKGCFVGTGASGTTDASSGLGILVRTTANLGGSSVGDRNLVSGNNGAGIQLKGTAMSMTNNLVGIDRNGNPLGNGTGVLVSSSTILSSIGGGDGGTRNVIAGNDGPGLRVLSGALGVVALGVNNFFANGGLAIDLGTDGVTPNDEGDLDTGPNGLQNYPVLTLAVIGSGKLRLEGFLESQPGQYRIRVFRNEEVDPSGFGEGEAAVDTFDIEIPEGETRVDFEVEIPLGLGQAGTTNITTLAENLTTSESSEFSKAIQTRAGGQKLVVLNTNDSGAGSFRAAVIAANLSGNPATIVFDIPGDAPHTISLLSGFKATVPLVIDGYSQPGSSKNSLDFGTNAVPGVFFDGSGAGQTKVLLQLGASGSFLRGVGFHNGPATALALGDGAQMEDVAVEGCFFGVDPSGLVDLGNNGNAVTVGEGTIDLIFGGDLPSQRNLVSGNNSSGIFDGGQGTRYVNNIIGGDATGAGNVGNEDFGLFLQGNDTVVGSDDPSLGNVIRGNGSSGIGVFGQGIRILANSIADNAGLGIDLDPDQVGIGEVTTNDADDADPGPNGLQNFPVLVGESILPGSAKFDGVLDVPDATLNAVYTLRFYDNESCDTSGHGEGAVFLGAANVSLSGNNEEFLVELPVTLGGAHIITVTATEVASGNTSEFSACFGTFEPPSACGDANGDTNVTAGDGQVALKTAVGSAQCDKCRCDVNLSNTITTSDALLILKSGVGQQVQLSCPPCS